MKLGMSYGTVRHLGFAAALERTRQAGYTGLEMDGGETYGGGKAKPIPDADLPPILAKAKQLGQAARDAGLEVVGTVFPYFSMITIHGQEFENYFRIAAALGSPSLRVFGMSCSGEKDFWQRHADNVRELETIVALAEKTGVRALLELHDGTMNESASWAWLLCRHFDPRHIGVIHDPENMVRSGKENWQRGIEMLGPYLAYFHFKDMAFVQNAETHAWQRQPVPLGQGLVDWETILRTVKTCCPDAYFVSENRFLRQSGAPEYADAPYIETDVKFFTALWERIA